MVEGYHCYPRCVQTRGGVAYETHGSSSAPAAVLVHGLTLDRATWAPVIGTLAQAMHVVALDLPGHGESRGIAPGIDAACDALVEVIDAACSQPPLLVGHSLGAAVVSVASAARPLRGIVLVDQQVRLGAFVRAVQAAAPATRRLDDLIRSFPAALRLDRLDTASRALVSAHCEPREELFLAYWGELLERDPDALDERVLAALRTANVPLLSIHASAPSAEYRTWLAAAVPEVTFEVWPEGGHFPHLGRPDAFARRLSAFARA